MSTVAMVGPCPRTLRGLGPMASAPEVEGLRGTLSLKAL